MKRILAPAEYTFDASAQTITINGFTPVLEYITTIINITDNVLIYSVTNTAKKGTLAGSVITLEYNTTSMSDTDELQIQYNDPAYIQPISATSLPLPSDAATQTTLAAVLAKLTADPATQTTLAAILAKIIAAPSTEAKQDSIITLLTTLSGLDYSTEAKQDSMITLLGTIDAALAGTLTVTTGLSQPLTDAQLRATAVPVSVSSIGLPTNAAQETGGNLAAILAKLSADPSTATLQGTANTALSNILAKIIAAPATEAKQDTLIAKDFATQTTLAAILAKIIAAPSTEAKQDTQITALGSLTETAPANDTASSGLNGRLQRIAQNITSLIARIPAALGQTTMANSMSVTIASNQSNVATNIAQMNGVATTMNNGVSGTGVQRVTIASDSTGTGLSPRTSGGLTNYHLVSAATTNATNLKSSAGQVFGWYIYNSNAAARKVAFHNTAGTPTAGSSVYFSLVIPPSSGANVEMTNGIVFSTGIAITTVTGLADSDNTAVALNDLVINIWYK